MSEPGSPDAGDNDAPLPSWLAAYAQDEIYEWAVLAWRRAAAVKGAWFDERLAEGVVREWPEWARLTTDRFAGMPFVLLPWQELIVRLLVGWMTPSELLDPITHKTTIAYGRLFRRLLLWIPRKNGKTEFLAALGLMFMAMDALPKCEGYVFARDEDQARVTLERMKSIAANSPSLKNETIQHRSGIYFRQLLGGFVLLTGAAEGKHGKMPSVIVGDEIHEWRSLSIANTLRQGTGTRLEPIELYGSTTGRKSNLIGYGVWEETLGILKGHIHDPNTLPVVFAAPPDAAFTDEQAWRLANPTLGLSPTIDYLRREAHLAANNPRKEAEFRCYHMNQWVDEFTRWLDIRKWDACAPDKTAWKRFPAELRGKRAFGAFDVSSTRDVTALTWLFPPQDGVDRWRLIARFWVPEATLEERVRDDRVPYDRWVEMGALETTPGDYVDQNYVLRAILEGQSEFDVERGGFDPWNARKLIADLHEQGVDPDLWMEMRQGILTLGEPSKHFERLVYSGQLDHGGHPILRWMAGNVVVRFDENLNFAPAKKRSREKIDGIVSTVMAVGLACVGEEQVISTGSDALVVL